MSVAARVSFFAVLAVLSGVGIVYAPILAYTAVAITFVVGLWTLAKSRRPSSAAAPGVADNAGKRAKPRRTLSRKLVSGFLLLWWLAAIVPIIAYSPRGAGDAAQASVGGSLRNQALIVSFGFVGALFLPQAIRRFDPAFRWVVALWTLHLCWMLASLSWSLYPPLTLRNTAAFFLLSVGSFGLGAGFYGSDPNGRDLFLRHVFVAGVLSALAVLLPLPFRWGQYQLLDPSQRLAIGGNFPTYVVHPVMCALLVLVATAVLRVRRWRNRDWFWVVVLVIPLLVLKSRGPILWSALALALFYLLYKTRIQDRVLQAGLLLAMSIGAYVYYSAGLYNVLIPYLARGDVQATMKLTGRVPLWEVMASEIGQHPWIGVGFAAFWSPENFSWVAQRVGFPAVSAHNGYLDMLLGTGAVGLAIILTFCLYTMAVVWKRARRGDPMGWLALLFLIFYLLQNLTSSIFTEFLEVPLIVILVMLGLMASRPIAGPAALRRAPGASQERPSGLPGRSGGARLIR